MRKYKRYIPIVAVILVALGVNLDQFGIDLNSLSKGGSATTSQSSTQSNTPTNSSSQRSTDTVAHGEKWSDTNPNVNQWHIFDGEINRSGKPVGFHSRPGGRDPETARVRSIRDRPNRSGVYTASIEIRDGNQWKEKFSSFFPDSMSHDDVLKAVLNAYNNSADPKAQPFEGPSGLGFRIQGYTSNKGGINTAFPIFVRGQ
ncbi:EndoU domain-containing protein [Granulosicoccus sp.]|nr:EndoU domain-containing protein [Granulosicoccus sp.]MDB4222731.1 EndoU domain-containing protein [Granulosicoccus sp.]